MKEQKRIPLEKKKISQKIFQKIKEEKIEMKPSLYFKITSCSFLLIAILFFSLAAFLVMLSVNHLAELESTRTFFKMADLFFLYLPMLPFLVGVLFLYLSAKFYRKGRIKCYHEDRTLFLVLIFGALTVALFLAKTELAIKANRAAESIREKGVLKKVYVTPKDFWNNPQRGTLSGIIIQCNTKKDNMKISTWEEETWLIDTQKALWHLREDQKIPGQKVKMVGNAKDSFLFEAWEIWPWHLE